MRLKERHNFATGPDILAAPQHPNGVLMVYGIEGRGTKNGKNRPVTLTARAAQSDNDSDRLYPFSNQWMRHAWEGMREHLNMNDDKRLHSIYLSPYLCL
jgi:hypothetical protein